MQEKKPKITVVGSINMDLVVSSPKWPIPGETIEGKHFEVFPGGKGANQAIAAARAGADVTFLGAVGSDDFGERAISNFQKNCVRAESIKVISEELTGRAVITIVDDNNTIIYVPGANRVLDISYIKENIKHLATADMVLLQNEIPISIQVEVANYCHEYGTPVIYNPAPARKVESSFLEKITYITPNEHELSILLQGCTEKSEDLIKKVICTKGSAGVEYMDSGKKKAIPSYKVDVIDTTGAGDTFNGVLAVQLALGKKIGDAIKIANWAAALSITKKGAQEGMPTKDEINNIPSILDVNV